MREKTAPKIFALSAGLLLSVSPSVGAAATGAGSLRSKDRNAAADGAERRRRRRDAGGGRDAGRPDMPGATTVSDRVVWMEEERFSTRLLRGRLGRTADYWALSGVEGSPQHSSLSGLLRVCPARITSQATLQFTQAFF